MHGTDGYEASIYPTQDHMPATFTVLNLPVEDIDQAVEGTRLRGSSIRRQISVAQER